MRKFNIALIIALSLVIGICSIASASDKLLDTEVKQVTIAQDKNGNDYGRIIIVENRELNGVKYTTDVVCMAFGSTVDGAKKLSAGDTIKAVVAENEYRGRLNYNIISFIN
jgi:hypothetical protein